MIDLGYTDIALHAAAATVVLLNAAFWINREWRQKPNHWRIFTSLQSFLEWFVPSVCVPILVYFVLSYMEVL